LIDISILSVYLYYLYTINFLIIPTHLISKCHVSAPVFFSSSPLSSA